MGGAEYQAMLIARGLADLAHEPLFLATDMHTEDEHIDGKLTIKQIPGRTQIGWRNHALRISKIVDEFQPDIVYVREFTEIGTACSVNKELNIPIVSMSCHAMETSPFLVGYHPLETVGYFRSRDTLAHFQSFLCIRSTAAHVCNTKALQQKLQRWYPQKALHTIYNGSPIPEIDCALKTSTGQVIWVNNLKRWKRPEQFIDLARRLPDYRFVMVGRISGGRTFVSAISKKLEEAPPNLSYLGPLPVDQVNELIGKSDLLLYTSLPVEGFGNSFIQAWLRCVPTLSLSFDLDGILERERIGRCSTSFERLVDDVDELMRDEKQRFKMGSRARKYASQNHNPEDMVLNYERLFNKVHSHGL